MYVDGPYLQEISIASQRSRYCINQINRDVGHCTLFNNTKTCLKEIPHAKPDPGTRTSQGKIKSKKSAPGADSMFYGELPNRLPFNQGYRADPSLFPYPHDSNLGNTEFKQRTLDQIAEAEVRAHREHKRRTSSFNLQPPSFAMNPKASVFTPSQSCNVTFC